MSKANAAVLGIVVTYHPAAEALLLLLQALAPQVKALLVIDNTPSGNDCVTHITAPLRGTLLDLRMVRIGDNIGIASAQNIGIRIALAEAFDYVLLCDQDSLPAADMVDQLLGVAEQLGEDQQRVGCVCATYVDRVTGAKHRFQVQEQSRFFHSSRAGDQATPWAELVTGIASGSLIPVGVFSEVGLMREEYFVDFVDTEWCHRARYHGYKLYGTSLAQMEHRVGEGSFAVWFGRWKVFAAYSPLRLRYRFRNAVFLLRSGFVPWRWKVRSAWTWLGDAYAHLLFARDRPRNLKAIIQGLWDGMHSRGGRLQ